MVTPRWPVAVFDLDGTLVDTIHLIVESYQHTFRTHRGHTEDEARIRSWIGRPLIEAFREVDAHEAEAMYATYLTWNRANTERLIRRYDGVEDLLVALRSAGVRVAVVTSKRRDAALPALRLCALESYVDLLVTMENTTRHKPDPEPLRFALSQLGIGADQACYVGDAAVDLLAAAAAGMAGIGVTWG
ncbi:MAG TPA: HAD-IA family hydrolase, partial [Candidatus Lustribacter sp.]|nr:HAD-IA family hydrolase [Candidatus Lustribacter sp.]